MDVIMPKVLVGVPTKGAIDIESNASIYAIDGCDIRALSGSLVDDAREMIATEAIEKGYEYLLWIDSDMVFNPEEAQNILKTAIANDIDILSGICFKRTAPYTPCFYKFKDNTEGKKYEERIEMYADYPQNTLFEIDGVGCAFQLVKTSVLKSVADKYGYMFRRDYPLGEDLSFCKRAKELGYKIYADSRIKIGHLSKVVITENTWLRAKQQLKQ